MRNERPRQGAAVALGLMVVFSIASQAFGQLERVPWERLPDRVADRLVAIEDLAVSDCPKGIERSPHARVVIQYIENTLYEWKEYEIAGADGKRRCCIVMIRPEPGPLSTGEAQVLLSASRMWVESFPDPADRVTLPASDPSLDRLPVRPSRRPPPPRRKPVGEPDGLAVEGILQDDIAQAGVTIEDVIGTDDRVRITATTDYQYNTICFTAFSFGGLRYRGTAFLVSPYVAITAAHNVWDHDLFDWATDFVVAPGQRQFVANGEVDRPYGTRTAVDMRMDPAYVIPSGKFEFDYGAVMFSTPFASISTFMPLVFNNEPTDVFTAGYPPEVQGETSSHAMWESEGAVLGVGGAEDRLLYIEADVSPGNSGGPIWYKSAPEAPPRVVGVLNFGDIEENGGVRFVSQNQTRINEWMAWTPPADDKYEENDTRLQAYDLSSHTQTWLSDIDGPAIQADDDWYRIEVLPNKERVTIDCRFITSEGDIDLQLRTSTEALLASSKSTTDDEYIEYVVPVAGEYYIVVDHENAGNTYDLWWDCVRPDVPPDPPTITSVTPTSGPVLSFVKIEGENFGFFQGNVQFDGDSGIVISWSDTLIECQVPGTAVDGNVTVQDTREYDSNSVPFTVTTPGTIHISNSSNVPSIENGSVSYPFSTIQRGIDSSSEGATVIVADGVYTGVGNRDIDFKGRAIRLRSENGALNCVVDCQGTEEEPHRGFIFAGGEGPSSVLEGFTITGAHAGSGVSCTNSSPAITNNIITGNTGDSGTGGINCIGSSAVIAGNVITGNTAISGGGIYLSGGSAVVTDNTISANRADIGGGISIDSAFSAISYNIIAGNRALAGFGGGVYVSNASPSLINNTIISNTNAAQKPDGSDATGGGVYAGAGGSLTIGNCILWGNTATVGPQIALGAPAILTVRYANVSGGAPGVDVEADATLIWDESNIEADPLFADPGHWDDNGTPDNPDDDTWVNGDYYLKSVYGRWDPAAGGGAGGWVADAVTSLCIDAGDPESDYSNEPIPNFGRVNIGAHGNTEGASKSGWNIPGDSTNDCSVNILDLIFIRNKLNADPASEDNWRADVTQDGTINILDMIFIRNKLNSRCE